MHRHIQTHRVIPEKMGMSTSLTVVVIISLSIFKSSVHLKYAQFLKAKVTKMYYILIRKQIAIHTIMMYAIYQVFSKSWAFFHISTFLHNNFWWLHSIPLQNNTVFNHFPIYGHLDCLKFSFNNMPVMNTFCFLFVTFSQGSFQDHFLGAEFLDERLCMF